MSKGDASSNPSHPMANTKIHTYSSPKVDSAQPAVDLQYPWALLLENTVVSVCA